MKKEISRVKAVKNYYNLMPKRMSELTGIVESTLNSYINGVRNPSTENIEKICSAFPEINKRWLEFGEKGGQMLLKVYGQNTVQNTTHVAAEKAGYNPIHTTQDDGEDYPKIVTNAKTAFIKYYQQMNLISQLMQSKQEEYQEVYEYLTK